MTKTTEVTEEDMREAAIGVLERTIKTLRSGEVELTHFMQSLGHGTKYNPTTGEQDFEYDGTSTLLIKMKRKAP